jgi:murein DD-endopeptidase MepM/ murein hydrolase activator NlpD
VVAGRVVAGRVVVGLVVMVSVVSGSVSAVAAAGATGVFRPPVEAPVLDPFRLPHGPYRAGNRGIEYATTAGQVVRAPADGTVRFAGPVAGALFVTVDHGGGLWSTAGFVAHVLVGRGEAVAAGEVIALAGGPVHFTVRVDGRYVDPATMFGRHRLRVRLVSRESPVRGGAGPATLPDGPRRAPSRQIGVVGDSTSVPTPVASAPGHGSATGKRYPSWQSSP